MGRDAQQGLLLEGRYRLVEPLGSGGFGRVWQARDEKLRVDVAIKELWLPQRKGSPEHSVALTRAVREARNAAQLRSHPNIVNVLDVLDVDEQPWIVMELVRGETLADRVKNGARLPVHETAMIGKALLDALEAAHAVGIIHRDVKPDNVMLAHDGRVLLADFGIAKNVGDYGITPNGNVIGSMAYLAPERLEGHDVPSGDLFSLGATLYHAVEGASPFDRDTKTATIKAVLIEHPPPPTHAGRLETAILRLLAKDPNDRPAIPEARQLLDATPTSADTINQTKPRNKPTATLRSQTAAAGRGSTPSGTTRRSASTGAGVVAIVAVIGIALLGGFAYGRTARNASSGDCVFYPAWDPDHNGPWDLEPCSLPWINGDHYKVLERIDHATSVSACNVTRVPGLQAGDVAAVLPANNRFPATVLCLQPK